MKLSLLIRNCLPTNIFQDYLTDFTPYKSGTWRNNDTIHVGTYSPPPYTQIESGLTELITYLKHHPTAVGRTTYYQLNFSAPEQDTFKKWLAFARQRLSFIPDNILYQ